MRDPIVTQLENLVAKLIKRYDVGSVAAELQNLAADLIGECDDKAFRTEAIKIFAHRVENFQDAHSISRIEGEK